ncbi:MAG: TIGR04076 family protein [Dehalococcoidales bacterium]|nr:TIGR04076 family protein [Dehalococcoidales bacterium]
MAKEQYKVYGKILSVKGNCDFGHKAGQKFELSGYSPNGLCGYFYNMLFPYIIMLEFGGKFPDAWGGEIMKFDCIDIDNAVRIELRRE